MPSAKSIAYLFAGASSIAVLWTFHAGKDLSWDLLHYHYYVAHAFAEGRLERDFFAASAQAYLNPVGYLPFYWMVHGGWTSAAVSAVLAVAHAANIVLLYAIAWRLFAHHEPRNRAIVSLLAAALGVASAVFWATVGTSFLDPLLTVPMLGGVLLLLVEEPRAAARRAAGAGMLFGIAAALKYSNAIFALAGVLLAVTGANRSLSLSFRRLLAYALGGVVGVTVFAGPTFLHLYREYGNPVFPLFNNWFRAPDFPHMSTWAERFAPRSIYDGVSFPLRAISPESMTYVEISAPDLRFAALAVLALALFVAALLRAGGTLPAQPARPAGMDLRLLGFFLLAYVAWLVTSSNGRYGMLVVLLVGLLVAVLADRLLPLGPSRIALLVLLVVQGVACAMISPPRWFMFDMWSTEWFPYKAAPAGQREPALYLTVETQAMTVAVPYLHPDSSFVNLRGQHSVQHSARRLQALLERHKGRVRTIGRALRLQRDGRPRAEVVDLYDSTLLRYGYRIDPDHCFRVAWRPERYDWLSQFANVLVSESAGVRESNVSLVACALKPGSWSASEIEEEQKMSALFDRIERSCPGIFRGQTAVTEKTGKEWSRSYSSLEAQLGTQQGALVLAPFFKLRHFYLGTMADWDKGVPAPLDKPCREGLPR